MTPIDQVFVLQHLQDNLGEVILNTYTYFADVGMTAINVAEAWIEDVFPAVMAIEGGTLVSREVKTYSLGDLADIDDQELPGASGYDSSDTLPVFNAIGYTLKPTTRAVRPGSKRYANIPEEVQIRGVITNATYLTEMEALRVALDTPISVDDTLFAAPVIVKRVKYVVPGSDPERFAYKFPNTDEDLVYATLRSVLTSPIITHQVSRGN
jgi:hypothetical protein